MSNRAGFWNGQPAPITEDEQKRWLEAFTAGSVSERAANQRSAAHNYIFKLLQRGGIDHETAAELSRDLAQDGYERLARRIDRNGPITDANCSTDEALRKYSYTTLRNLVMDRYRQTGRAQLVPSDDVDGVPGPSVSLPRIRAAEHAWIETTGGVALTHALLAEVNRIAAKGEIRHADGRLVTRHMEARINAAKVLSLALAVVAHVDEEEAPQAIGAMASWDGSAHSHWIDQETQARLVTRTDPRFFKDPQIAANTKAQNKKRLFEPAALLVKHAAHAVLEQIGASPHPSEPATSQGKAGP